MIHCTPAVCGAEFENVHVSLVEVCVLPHGEQHCPVSAYAEERERVLLDFVLGWGYENDPGSCRTGQNILVISRLLQII